MLHNKNCIKPENNKRPITREINCNILTFMLQFFFVVIIISEHNIVHNIIKNGKQKQQQHYADIIINEKLKNVKIYKKN